MVKYPVFCERILTIIVCFYAQSLSVWSLDCVKRRISNIWKSQVRASVCVEFKC